MADVLLPLHLRQARTSFSYLDNTGVSRPAFGGAVRTAARGGDRLGASIELTRHGGRSSTELAARAALRSWIASLRGRQNRAYITDLSYRKRGSFATSELLSNNTFADGTTGWLAISGGANAPSGAVNERVYRATRTGNDGFGQAAPYKTSVAVLQYVPYIARAFVRQGRGTPTFYLDDVGVGALQTSTQTFGMRTATLISQTTSANPGITCAQASGDMAWDFYDVHYMSLSRGALVDNGENLFARSDEFDNVVFWATTRASVSANATIAPDGLTTADSLVEDSTASNSHLVFQTRSIGAAAADYAFTVALKAGARTFAALSVRESAGGHEGAAWFNLTSGTVGTTSTSGANMTNVRAFITSLGNGWHACTVVARKSNSATAIDGRVYLANADNSVSYTGNGSSNIYCWRATMAQSSVPSRLVQTTAAAVVGGTSQTGSGLHTKGWPASTSGLLFADDQIEVITSRGSELKILTASVNSDGAGRAYVQFEPPLRGTAADSAAIVVNQPMGYFIYSGESPGWDNEPGQFSQATCEFEEA